MIDDRQFTAILAGARRGDELSVAVLFADLQPRLLRFLRSQEPRVADDLAGEVWIAIAGGVDRFEGTWHDFRAWAFAIARRRLVDHRRRAVRRREAPIADVPDLDGASMPDDAAVANLSGEAAVTVIRQMLPPDQADVVLLRVVGDLDAEQVAAVMGRSVTWVRVNQHRALRRLAERLRWKMDVTQ